MYNEPLTAEQIRELNELKPMVDGTIKRRLEKAFGYIPPWYHARLPFHIDISLNIGSTMFDFCFWNLPEVLSIGVFWIHLDIQVGGRR